MCHVMSAYMVMREKKENSLFSYILRYCLYYRTEGRKKCYIVDN